MLFRVFRHAAIFTAAGNGTGQAGISLNWKDTLPQVPVISIVDDDGSVREATERLIRSLGYEAATFGSAKEFLTSQRLYDTSCLIADVQMPGLSGIELQSHLIAEGRLIPLILITAFPDERTRLRALKAGAICFLSKPCDEETLMGCLDKALNRCAGTK